MLFERRGYIQVTTVQCSKSTPEPWPELGVVTYDIGHRSCWVWENDMSSDEWIAGHDGKGVAKIEIGRAHV